MVPLQDDREILPGGNSPTNEMYSEQTYAGPPTNQLSHLNLPSKSPHETRHFHLPQHGNFWSKIRLIRDQKEAASYRTAAVPKDQNCPKDECSLEDVRASASVPTLTHATSRSASFDRTRSPLSSHGWDSPRTPASVYVRKERKSYFPSEDEEDWPLPDANQHLERWLRNMRPASRLANDTSTPTYASHDSSRLALTRDLSASEPDVAAFPDYRSRSLPDIALGLEHLPVPRTRRLSLPTYLLPEDRDGRAEVARLLRTQSPPPARDALLSRYRPQGSPDGQRGSRDSRSHSIEDADLAAVAQQHACVAIEDPDRISIEPRPAFQDTSKRPASEARQNSLTALEQLVTCRVANPQPEDVGGSMRRRGRRNIVLQKHCVQAAQVTINGLFIFSTWWWTQYWYILLVFISATVALNIIMIGSIAVHKLWFAFFPERTISPEKPESLVLLMPCYNETSEECTKSLDSLVNQTGIDEHPRSIMIICDGKVRGPGMDKTTADYLLEDILVEKTERRHIRHAYTAWDQQYMDVVIQRGKYKGVPYFCIIKQQNQGKRDGLIVVRSFLYNFNIRDQKPAVIFSQAFFAQMASFLINDAGQDRVDHLVGMDADTVFDKQCIAELLKQSRYPCTVGVCGYVAVDFHGGGWDPWRLYQSSEYTIAQALRRLHQSIVTNKVSCLPGCCQLLKVCEETCGDDVLLRLFGYSPRLTDNILKQIRATASEDRNHVCHMLSARPKVKTRQALAAKAFTDVPHSWSVFLSQRRRWTLGATSNDLLLVTAPGVQWFERILATVNVITWTLNPFIFASIASFIYAITKVPGWIVGVFVAVMFVPILYYIAIPTWLYASWKPRFQFWAGMCMYVAGGPFIGIAVLLYASWNMDSFGWGKTRKVVSEDNNTSEESEDSDSLQAQLEPRSIMDEEKRVGL